MTYSKKNNPKKEKTPKKTLKYKEYNTTKDLVKDTIYQCMMGVHRSYGDENSLVSIDYRYQPDITELDIDLDNFIDNAVIQIDNLKDTYHELNKIEDEDERFESIVDDIESELFTIFPIFNCMHSDSSNHFVQVIYQHYDT